MKSTSFIHSLRIAATCIAILAGMAMADANNAQNDIPGLPAIDVALNGTVFSLEVASTPDEQRRGLMFRTELPQNAGMIFVFSQESIHRFWMKNTLIPLDIIFVNSHGIITAAHSMPVEPPRRPDESLDDYHERLPGYSSNHPVICAIELPQGTIKQLNLVTGTRLCIAFPWLPDQPTSHPNKQ